ncbi:bacterio-opsin activator domain-containing protein [Halostella litorea]|uniref:bacterio-opsin activator domain-containing protein n=1 Tax=Halostella litorea TaxID=2528831 RepID=UPI001092AB1B|nr:bacterio-opsin activator domain-containing protein [Halostella litorea]
MPAITDVNRSTTSDSATLLYVGADPGGTETAAARVESELAGLRAEPSVGVDAAVTRVEGGGVDCVVSEPDLPDGTATELLDRLREVSAVPFVLFAERPGASTLRVLYDYPATDYVARDGDGQFVALAASVRGFRAVSSGERAASEAGDGADPVSPTARAVLGRVTDAFFALDGDWRFTYVNDRAETVLGRSAGELIDRSIWEAFPDAVGTTFEEKYREAAAEQRTVSFTEYFPPLSAWFEVHAYPSPTGLSVYFRDVTERERLKAELREERALKRRIVETSPVGITVLDSGGRFQFANEYAEELLGRSRDTIRELRYNAEEWDIVGPDGEPLPDDRLPFRRAVDAEEQFVDQVIGVARPDGDRVWLSVNGTQLYDPEDELDRVVLTLEDVTERRRREAGLRSLNGIARELMDAESAVEMAEVATDRAGEVLGLPETAVALYDGRGHLDPVTGGIAGVDDGGSVDGSGTAWSAFVESEQLRYRDGDDSPFTDGVAVPLGRHGVFVAGTRNGGAVDRSTTETASLLAATLRAALDRAERDRELREQEAELADRNAALERTNRINEVIRNVQRALVGATTRAEIETAVCSELAAASPYSLAWVGDSDPASNRVEPRERAGSDDGYLDAVPLPLDGPVAELPPSARALRRGELQVETNLMSDPPFESWRQAALTRGFSAIVGIPLRYDESTYGVLTVATDRPGVFDGTEREVLAELGDTVAHAINAVEAKNALVSDAAVELEFRINDPDLTLSRALEEEDGRFEFQGVVPNDDHGRLFFTVAGTPPERVGEFAREALEITNLSLVAERGDGALYEADLTGDSITRTVLDHGGVPRAMTASDGDIRLVVDLGTDADVREFAEAFRSRYETAELVRRRERDRSVRTGASFRAELDGRLTDRQAEVLRSAYLSGFFSTPRDRTGSEIADSLGVSQPTFNNHLRAAQRKLLTLLFDEE